MIGDFGARHFQMIVGVHDLSEPPQASGDEMKSWMAFSEVRPLLDQLVDNTSQTGVSLHVTSDDAFRSDYDLLLPWLLEHGLVGTFFIPTRFLDRPGRLTVADLRAIAAEGMRIGVHGARHLAWGGLTVDEFLADVREGRESLQQMLGMPVDVVAPPFGSYNGRIVKQLVEEGFREIHTCRSGLALESELLKPRNMIKKQQLGAVLATSRRRGGFVDAARCRIRRMRASLEGLAGTT